jgi:hypothetical protein
MSLNSESKRIELLELARSRVDGDTPGRIRVAEAVAIEYPELIKPNVKFPPVRIWFKGEHYWLSDSFRRIKAANSIGKWQIAAEGLFGTLDGVKRARLSVNGSHGFLRGPPICM